MNFFAKNNDNKFHSQHTFNNGESRILSHDIISMKIDFC